MGPIPMFVIIVLLLYLSITPSSSMNTTDSLTESSSTTTTITTTSYMTSTEIEDEEHTFSAPWIYTMEGAGSLGIILISIMSVHAIYQLYKNELAGKFSRVVYVIFFASYWLTCVAYTFFRTDLILPMGAVISCKFGFLFGTNCVFVAKLFMFIIFLLRIDLAFHSSALGYSRCVLAFIMILYIITICLLNAAFIWDAMGLIDLYDSSLTAINVCTTGNSSDYYIFIVGTMGLLDMMFSVLVGMLFVCKLRTVNKLTQDERSSAKKSRSQTKKMNSLGKLMRKQTILVLLAVITSIFIFGLGAVFVGFSLMIPLDALINVFCVWLMFRFSDNVWNKITHCCCYCCYCCGEKDDFLMTMHSFSKRISLHSQTSATGGTHRSNTVSRTNHSVKHETPGPITQRTSEKQNKIQIKFDNDIKPEDLNDIRKKNTKKIKIVTTTTTTTTNTTTIKKQIIEENSIDSPNISNGSDNADNADNAGYPIGWESHQKEVHIELQENKDI